MHTNKVVLSVVLYGSPLNEDLDLLKGSLLLTVENLIHFGFIVSLDQSQVVVFDSVTGD